MLLGVFRPLHQVAELLAGLAQNHLGVGDDVAAGGGAENDQEFERLPQHRDVTIIQHVAAKHAENNGGAAGDQEHGEQRVAVDGAPVHRIGIGSFTPNPRRMTQITTAFLLRSGP